MENNRVDFEYTYSAEQQAEIDKIRSKYLPKEDDKLTQLRKLDATVTRKGTVVGIIVGVIGLLAFGSGMSLILVVGVDMLFPSVIIGGIGIVAMIVAYPLFKKITEKERARVAPQILALSEEIMHN